jgi:hypothetical protein
MASLKEMANLDEMDLMGLKDLKDNPGLAA